MTNFVPTRAAALATLTRFVPDAGRNYAERRNFDVDPPATSRLSPYLRHRLVTEAEVLRLVVQTHGTREAEAFISEILWRTYSKGWLEMRPSVWATYRSDLDVLYNRVKTETGLRTSWEAAGLGQTGIDCFDHWARQLAATGWLHNHARMWFALIWIFTLRLPWQLGADLFLRLLIDGDPASNTLGWRWVAGLQTRGKHYVATAENIRRFTGGRFDPKSELVENPDPLLGPEPPAPGPLPQSRKVAEDHRTGLLLGTGDLGPDALPAEITPSATFTLSSDGHRSPGMPAALVRTFRAGVLSDAIGRLAMGEIATGHTAAEVSAWAADRGITQIIHTHAPTGPEADIFDEVRRTAPHLRLAPQVRPYDALLWRHANRGFFRFRKDMPDLARVLG